MLHKKPKRENAPRFGFYAVGKKLFVIAQDAGNFVEHGPGSVGNTRRAADGAALKGILKQKIGSNLQRVGDGNERFKAAALDAALNVTNVGCRNLCSNGELLLSHFRQLALLTDALAQCFKIHVFTLLDRYSKV